MSPPDRLRSLLAEPGFVVMPAIWNGISAKLAARAGFKTAFMSGSCVAATRLGGPDLDPGHEIAGEVAKVGAAVTRVRPGDRVAVDPSRPCRHCEYCLEGKPRHCLDMRFSGSAMRFQARTNETAFLYA